MKLKDFKKQKDNFLNKSVIVTLHNGQKYRGSFYCENDYVKVGNESILVKDIESLISKDLYKYVSVSYDDDFEGKEYSYKTTLENISIGDTVLVDRNGNEAYGTVKNINYYTEEDAPYPVDKTKDIIEIVDKEEDEEYVYGSIERIIKGYNYPDRLIHDYKNILLNNMFGRISIKRLMKLIIPQKGQEKFLLFYYPKFNTFFYKIIVEEEEYYKMAEYDTNVITDEMFRIIEKESIEVLQERSSKTTDKEAYIRAVKFCLENNLRYSDDTDILEFCDEKKKLYKDRQKYKEPKEFKNINEIKNYLKNEYKKAYWKTPKPSYFIEDNHIIHYLGWLEYDMRIFKVYDFMVKNNYVDKNYYNIEKYPEFFEEDYQKYDYDNLDIKRVSYLFLRTFNVERICEGLIDNMVMTGIMLKLVERAEKLKNKNICERRTNVL